jgi:succinate dehydrogenase / fumarate reductase membrane anchor subunit
MLGRPHAEVVAYFSRPFPAIVAALTLVVGFMHFKGGVQVMIEDYFKGLTRKILIIAMICLSYAAAATGLFAIARIAL